MTTTYMTINAPSASINNYKVAIFGSDEELVKLVTFMDATEVDYSVDCPANWFDCDLDAADFDTTLEYVEAGAVYTAAADWAGRFTAPALLAGLIGGYLPTNA